MTKFAVERALWDISGGGAKVMQFLTKPDEFFSQYQLTDEEKANLKSKNVRALSDQGQSDMLLMMFWNAVSGGFPSLPEYMGRMNTPAPQ